jgi:hypothetical protein
VTGRATPATAHSAIVRVTCLGVFFVLAVAPLPAAAMPLSKPEVLQLLQKGVRQDRVVEVVKELGIDFKVTPEVMTELTGAGAGAALIAELMALKPDDAPSVDRPPSPPTAPAPAPASPPVGAAPDTPNPPPVTPSAPSAPPAPPTVGAEVSSAIRPPPERPVPPDPPARPLQIMMPAIPAPPPVPPPPGPPMVASIASSPPLVPSAAPVTGDQPTPAPAPTSRGSGGATDPRPVPAVSPVLDPAASPAPAPAPPPAEPNTRELVKPLLDQAQALATDGDLRGAQELVAKALEIDPGEPEVWKVFKGIEHDVLVRAEGFLTDGQVRRALREFQTIITKNPESAPGHAGMGSALLQLKNYVEAVAALERALALDPGNARYRQTLTRARDLQKASKALERTGQENLQRMLGDQPGTRQP